MIVVIASQAAAADELREVLEENCLRSAPGRIRGTGRFCFRRNCCTGRHGEIIMDFCRRGYAIRVF